ncbi:MAG: ribonuclease III [Clostridia bacterium]|nr:ribonuclease III [Clostridia bacterium]
MNGSELSPLLYAYLGDSVLEVMVRERLISRFPDAAACNRAALSFVTAARQAEAAKRLRDHLTPEEEAFFLHARNAKPHSLPHNAQPYDYHLATALEALFGMLHLIGNKERRDALFQIAFPELN